MQSVAASTAPEVVTPDPVVTSTPEPAGPSTPEEGAGDLEAALCADLTGGGMSLYQGWVAVLDYMESEGRDDPEASAATFIDRAVRSDCPALVGEWEATIWYEDLLG